MTSLVKVGYHLINPYTETKMRVGDGPKRNKVFKPPAKDVQLVPIGPKQGVGTAYGWKFPSFVVTRLKSKDFMLGQAVKYVDGTGP